jgi:hypothetical protein
VGRGEIRRKKGRKKGKTAIGPVDNFIIFENYVQLTNLFQNYYIFVIDLKGTVQRKLTGVESDMKRKVFLSH